MTTTSLLVVGAGPYGLAVGACARHLGVDTLVVGRPLDLWTRHMPKGLLLRSGIDWHLDPLDTLTFEAFVRMRGLAAADVTPVPLETFVEYATWFMNESGLSPVDTRVASLVHRDGWFDAELADGERIRAQHVVLAVGFDSFAHAPADIVTRLPPGSWAHTCEASDLSAYRGLRVLIVGGRQSAFEWAALLRESGASDVHVVHRHATPAFGTPDWSWVQPMVRRTLDDRGWWRGLTDEEREAIRLRFWSAGRLVLEQWLEPRVRQPNVHLHERAQLSDLDARADGSIDVRLDTGSAMTVDRVILATGYRPDVTRLDFVDPNTIGSRIDVTDGFPILETSFQTSVPGLFMAGLAATRDFGPFFGFTVGCPVAGRIIGETVART